ncbi:Hypothetical predicted protein [Paramuricea clavata]|uniref:Uncharacterized protein n=1 Tax=Paramuricea clavata TaxID=317549 RepID=A0A6S7GBT5_PARCT|nr:Hypothetical predicted protein [Paramuricea clavata]
MPFSMNKRSSGSDRPRSARLRRRPSIPQDEHESIAQCFEGEQSELTNKKNTKSKPELNLLETSNRLGITNRILGRENEKANHTLTVPSSMEIRPEAKNANFVNYYQRGGREPPKSPRILPKLEKNSARKAIPEESPPPGKNEAPDFSMFLDKKKRVDRGSLQLGKQYSVLPNISHTNEGEGGNVSL